MSNTKRDVGAEGGKDGEADPEEAEPVGVPDHDGTPSKLFPGTKGGKGAAKRKGEPSKRFRRKSESPDIRDSQACDSDSFASRDGGLKSVIRLCLCLLRQIAQCHGFCWSKAQGTSWRAEQHPPISQFIFRDLHFLSG